MSLIPVSIIIVNFNGKKFLGTCLDSLLQIDYPDYEIIVVDNASLDGSADFIRKFYPDIKIVENDKNLGFAEANNIGVGYAKGDYIFFLNNDTKADSKVIFNLVTAMRKNSDIGICGCRIMSYDSKFYFHTGIGIDIFGFPVNSGKVFYAEGCALMIKRKIFEEIAGFDSKYFMFHEDIDLAWRTWLSGYKVIAIPEAIIYHAGGATAGGSICQGYYVSTLFRRHLSERNNLRTLLKNYGLISLLIILPGYFLINLGEMLIFFLAFKPKVAWCYPRAYLWNLMNVKNILFSRHKIQRTRKISDREIIRKMLHAIGKFIIFQKIKIPKFS